MNRAIRASVIHFPDHSAAGSDAQWQCFDDAVLWIEEGYVKALGDATEILPLLPQGVPVEHYPNRILIPGLIDLHVHYPQMEIIAAHGTQLLDWLNTYTFAAEKKYTDLRYAEHQASGFLDQMLAQGTTTAVVFATSAKTSVDAIFNQALERNLRLISGKVLMDRNAPAELCDTPQSGYDESAELIEHWQGRGRLGYAITPRFAPTSTAHQLDLAGQLLRDYPATYMQTHLAENREECAWVAELFPESASYLEVYRRAGLVTERSVFAHGIHLSDPDLHSLAESGSTLCHCPSSNLFLGSGLFSIQKAINAGVRVGFGTDVGAGSSLSLLGTLGEAYKVQQLLGENLSTERALYLATLGAARSLSLESRIGNFEAGKEADCVLLDPAKVPQLALRLQAGMNLEETLFALMVMGDDRAVSQTWVMGAPVQNPTPPN